LSLTAAELRNSFWKILPIPLGFSIPRLYIGEGASSGGCQGTLTMGGHGQGLGHAPLLCGRPLVPPSALFWSSVLFQEK
jgi:hypothetical protein